GRDRAIERHAFALAALRARCADLMDIALLRDEDVVWLDERGEAMSVAQWEQPRRRCVALHFVRSGWTLCVNGSGEAQDFRLGDDRYVSVASRSLMLLDPLSG
ncbi:MAG: glycogen debranching enzyme GlgX, partial [Sphingobium sp.]|nr:glycogen debranching enzyme GlgX [Sphingobium sp.]